MASFSIPNADILSGWIENPFELKLTERPLDNPHLASPYYGEEPEILIFYAAGLQIFYAINCGCFGGKILIKNTLSFT